jgi:hypothetical protein
MKEQKECYRWKKKLDLIYHITFYFVINIFFHNGSIFPGFTEIKQRI